MNLRVFLVCVSLAAVSFAPVAYANTTQGAEAARSVPDSGPVQPYLRTHFELRREVDSGRGYRSLDEGDRTRLFQAQDRLFGLLARVRNFEDLTAEQRELLADIHATLLPAMAVVREQEVLCRRDRPTGSRIKETKCFTRADLARMELKAQRDTDRRSNTGRPPRGGPSGGLMPEPFE